MKFSKNHVIHSLVKDFRADNRKLAAEHRQTMQEAEKALRELKATMDKLNKGVRV